MFHKLAWAVERFADRWDNTRFNNSARWFNLKKKLKTFIKKTV